MDKQYRTVYAAAYVYPAGIVVVPVTQYVTMADTTGVIIPQVPKHYVKSLQLGDRVGVYLIYGCPIIN